VRYGKNHWEEQRTKSQWIEGPYPPGARSCVFGRKKRNVVLRNLQLSLPVTQHRKRKNLIEIDLKFGAKAVGKTTVDRSIQLDFGRSKKVSR